MTLTELKWSVRLGARPAAHSGNDEVRDLQSQAASGPNRGLEQFVGVWWALSLDSNTRRQTFSVEPSPVDNYSCVSETK